MNPGNPLAPFYRGGKSRPLTVQDYANIMKIGHGAAVTMLVGLVKAGRVQVVVKNKSHPTIYEVT